MFPLKQGMQTPHNTDRDRESVCEREILIIFLLISRHVDTHRFEMLGGGGWVRHSVGSFPGCSCCAVGCCVLAGPHPAVVYTHHPASLICLAHTSSLYLSQAVLTEYLTASLAVSLPLSRSQAVLTESSSSLGLHSFTPSFPVHSEMRAADWTAVQPLSRTLRAEEEENTDIVRGVGMERGSTLAVETVLIFGMH